MSNTNGSTKKGKLDLVGTAEAADILGVERPRIGRWLKEGKMPDPVSVLRATPVWMRADIETMKEWVEARRRTRPTDPDNPCGCGCGKDAGVYTRSDRRRGQERGAPRRYVPGHEKHALAVEKPALAVA